MAEEKNKVVEEERREVQAEGEVSFAKDLEVLPVGEARPVKKYVAELVGTFVLVFIGCGSAVFFNLYGAVLGVPSVFGLLGTAFAFGLSFLVMVYTIGGISGCHINPAVTVSMFVAGKIKARDAVAYVLVQCVGAVLAAGVLYGIASGDRVYSLGVFGLGQNGYGGSVGGASPAGFPLASCFAAEVVLTFIFLLVIHGTTSERAPKGFAGVAIGFSLVLVHIAGIPVTGTSVNPARSLGPAVFVGGTALGQLWLFWVAPLIGGILAALVWQAIELK